MRFSVLIVALAGIAVTAQQPPPAPPILQEPQTLLLWPEVRPGAQGRRGSRQAGAHRLHAAEHHRADDRGHHRAGRQLPAPVDEPRGARAGQLLQRDGHRRLRAALPARPAVSPSDRARRRAARDPHCARSRASGVALAPDRIGFMGFSAGGHLASSAVDAFRRRQPERRRSDRSRQQPAGLRGARLPGDLVHRAVDASGLEDGAARRRARPRAGAQPVE